MMANHFFPTAYAGLIYPAAMLVKVKILCRAAMEVSQMQAGENPKIHAALRRLRRCLLRVKWAGQSISVSKEVTYFERKIELQPNPKKRRAAEVWKEIRQLENLKERFLENKATRAKRGVRTMPD